MQTIRGWPPTYPASFPTLPASARKLRRAVHCRSDWPMRDLVTRPMRFACSTVMTISPPCGENLIALDSRLVRTWTRRSASAHTMQQGDRVSMTKKRANRQTADALADLKRGWNGWIVFALERPKLFHLMVESTRSDPSTNQEAFVLMRAIVECLRNEGSLTTDVDTAARTIWAAANVRRFT
jgi:hypothetical protein